MGRPNRVDSISSITSQEFSERDAPEKLLSTAPTNQPRKVTAVRHNSVVSAMLVSNSLRDCSQVEDMVTKCVAGKEKSYMCSTAQRYFTQCNSTREL